MNSDGSDIYIYPRVLDLGLDAEVSFLLLKNTGTITRGYNQQSAQECEETILV